MVRRTAKKSDVPTGRLDAFLTAATRLGASSARLIRAADVVTGRLGTLEVPVWLRWL